MSASSRFIPLTLSRLLGRMRVGRKLMLIYALDLTAVIYVSSVLINEKYIAIDFARKEIAGNEYIATLRDSLIAIAQTDANDTGEQSNLPAGPALLARAEADYGEGMSSADLQADLSKKLTRLGEASFNEIATRRADALVAGRELVTRIGNQSNLILDPDLDSYYTMSLIVLRYPELLGLINDIAQLLDRTAGADTSTADTRTRFLILEGKLDAAMQGIGSDHSEAFAAGRPALRAALEQPLAQLIVATERFRNAAREVVEGTAAARETPALLNGRTSVLTELKAAWRAANQAMRDLLDQRVHNLFQRMWLHLGTALALLLAILAIVTFVARQIAGPLRHLASVADEVRRSADYTLRADWHSSDEIGRLVAAFNDMLAQLDHDRETQKELAASARAADAQHALVEATPIPLMVTTIPDHRVLHANPPAETWLDGIPQDPWKRGLEPAVRARFFQQLSDKGAVDEFEVRWCAGSEPVWAVLSARRVRFQGLDAVLTAFTPINHLKLMERRLELWAKVFEASTEGILIVDATQRILTANQAFSQHTGYELQEVIGEKPSLVLQAGEHGNFPEVMWQQVARRGTWQGELQIRRRDGTEYPAWLLVSAVKESRGDVSHFIFTSIDISDRKKSEQRIRFLAEHDVLTELPNRSLCSERLRLAVQQAQRTGQKVAVLFIDLDRFKDINDSLGHHIGDGLLRSVSKRLLSTLRAGDTVCRLGGDEFVVVLTSVHDVDEVAHIAEQRLISLIRQPHLIEGAELHISCSVGVAIYPDDATDIDELMRHADTAMYQAKAAGKDGMQFFTAEMTKKMQARVLLDAALRHALEANQFLLHYQPRVDASSGELLSVEALLRWDHPEHGIVSPAVFIQRAEEIGLIVPIGAWIFEESCRQIAGWRQQGLEIGISVNLSARQLRDEALINHVRDSMTRHGLGPGIIEMELTETLVMDDAEGNLEKMHALRQLGISLAIDDFGTGYSSLAYLNRLPIDKLKIDRSFVHDMLVDKTDRAITTAVIGLGHTLGLKVVAEGVEEEAQAALLRDARCDELQGYLFGRPMSAPALVEWAWQRQRNAA